MTSPVYIWNPVAVAPHWQHVGPQQLCALPGLVARTKALINLPSTASARAGSTRRLQERLRLGSTIDAGRLQIDAFESRFGEFAAVFAFFKRSGDAADPQLHVLPHPGGHFTA